MEKVGRNQPCPCGSGKKYKKCCLKKTSSEPLDYLWHKLRRIQDELAGKLLRHAKKIHGRESIIKAWDDFSGYLEEEGFDPDSLHAPAFFHWYLYNWRPKDFEKLIVEGAPPTVAQSYLNRLKNRAPDMERRLIELTCEQAHSFYEIKERRPGEGLLLRDILLEKETYVTEQTGSETCKEGYILFGKVIEYDHVGLMIGVSAILIPPSYKTDIIDLRSIIRSEDGHIDSESLHDWDIEINELYFDICERMYSPPQLHNTDGDPLCPHDMVFEVASAQTAFDQIKSLALDIPEGELLEDAEFHENGDVKKVAFRWLKKGNEQMKHFAATTLGNIVIEGQQLKVSINSENRAKQIREKIENLLGDQVAHKATKIQSMESLLNESEEKSRHKEPISPDDLPPEVQEHMDKMMDAHWSQWIHDELPALDGLSPFEAVKDPDGREKVEALLKDMEIREKRGHAGVKQIKYIERARRQLGISESQDN